METVTDIQLLSSWCPGLGGDVCVSALFFFNITLEYPININQLLFVFPYEEKQASASC